jgi:hypothetical protein
MEAARQAFSRHPENYYKASKKEFGKSRTLNMANLFDPVISFLGILCKEIN